VLHTQAVAYKMLCKPVISTEPVWVGLLLKYVYKNPTQSTLLSSAKYLFKQCMSPELLIHYFWLPCSVHTVYKAAKVMYTKLERLAEILFNGIT